MAEIRVVNTNIKDLVIIEPTIFSDARGYFVETYNREVFEKNGLTMNFVQDNESKSKRGVLRGLHFQTKFSQGKLVRVLSGEVYDVGVDLRKNSPTYGQYAGVLLSSENKKMFYVPEGFAHGFLVLSEEAVFTYKCTNVYHPEYDGGIIYNDSDINIDWPIKNDSDILLSDKDRILPTFQKANIAF